MNNIKVVCNISDEHSGWVRFITSSLKHSQVITVESQAPKTAHFILESFLNIERKYFGGCEDDVNPLDIDLQTTSDMIINLSSVPSSELDIDGSIIEFRYRGQLVASANYIGILEGLQNSATIDITAVLYKDRNYSMLDIARYNLHWSCTRSVALVRFSLLSFIRKVLSQPLTPVAIDNQIIAISRFEASRYIVKAIGKVIQKYYRQVGSKLFHICDGQEWTVMIGKGDFLKSDLSKLKINYIPQNEFWADPFLYERDGELWLFFERFPFSTFRGKISCTKIVNGNPTDVIDVLDKPYHLSYPNIFEEDGELFMMPECGGNLDLEVYRCIEFPHKWELYSTAFKGESLADSVYYKDDNGDRWLFTSRSNPVAIDHCNELWLYKVDSLRMNKIESHKLNPIVIDSSSARNGGAIYRGCDGCIYRVAQINTNGMYGKGVSINRINVLSIEEYIETPVRRVDASFNNNIIGLHQMHQIHSHFVIDARIK